MDIIALNDHIEDFVNKHDLTSDALALKQEHAIAKSAEWQKILNEFAENGRVLRVGIIGRVKAGKSSMLNALLFNGNDILPKAATPMTAALTIMEYSDTVRAEVDFFTQTDIDEIKIKHDAYVQLLKQKISEKESEIIEKAIEKKKREQQRGKYDVVLTEVKLTAEEEQECRDKAFRQAEREMKDEPTFASYDQYERIEASGKSLRDLEQYKTIQAASVEELMNGALNQFVGSSGAFMPFTKSVTLYIPEQGLQGLQIIDTPGINDPVTSRGERTEQLLAQCDVVLIVSPSGQFLSSEDTDLMHRVTTKEGTQQAYIIASQVDNQLFGSESVGLSNPSEVLQKISGSLTTHARNTLQKQVQQYPEMKVATDKLSANPVICSSSVAFSLLQRFDEQHTWDANLKHVWHNLNQKYPSTFSHAELAKSALSQMANIDKLHQIIDEVTTNKEQILVQRRMDFENSKRNALQAYLKAWEMRISEQVRQIQNADVGKLRQQETMLNKQQTKIQMHVGRVYDDLVGDIKLNLDKQLKDKLSSIIRQYDTASEGAQGTATESKEVYVGRGGFLWLKNIYETSYYEVTAVKTNPIRNAIEEIRNNLEDELSRIAKSYSQAWKKKIYNQVVGALREVMGDEELDITMVNRALKNVVARIPEVTFRLADDMPSSLEKSQQLKGSEAEAYISDADDYVFNLRRTVRNEIISYMTELLGNLKKVDLPKELTGNLEKNLKQLLHEIENKEASLYRYLGIQKELRELQQKVNS